MSKTALLIDGDQFLYRACAAVEHEVRWDLENHVLFSNAEDAFKTAMGGIQKVMDRFKGAPVRLAFTKSESFRKGLFAPYKGNRVGVRKPMCYVETRERLEASFPSLDLDGLEADDILGIWATRENQNHIIVSDDKDLKTVPCRLLRQGELTTISPGMADQEWMMQTLKGDTADNFPGCPGVGEKTAEKLLMGLRSIEEMWPIVVKAFEKASLTEADALIQARCARILRSSDWDSTKKEIRLWTP